MSGSLPQPEILTAADGCFSAHANVPWAERQAFAPTFRRFAQQFNAVMHNLSQHSRRELSWMS